MTIGILMNCYTHKFRLIRYEFIDLEFFLEDRRSWGENRCNRSDLIYDS